MASSTPSPRPSTLRPLAVLLDATTERDTARSLRCYPPTGLCNTFTPPPFFFLPLPSLSLPTHSPAFTTKQHALSTKVPACSISLTHPQRHTHIHTHTHTRPPAVALTALSTHKGNRPDPSTAVFSEKQQHATEPASSPPPHSCPPLSFSRAPAPSPIHSPLGTSLSRFPHHKRNHPRTDTRVRSQYTRPPPFPQC